MRWNSFILKGPKGHSALWLTWALLLAAAARPAQAAASLSPQQFIFLIEASSGMADRRSSVTNFVCEMLRREFQGRIRPGETYEIWTFSERVRTNVYSPDTWFSHQKDHYAERAAWFLRSHKFEKKARMDRAVSALRSLAARNGDATIFLLTDGNSLLSGTPFDAEVNEVFLRHRHSLKEAGKPFVALFQMQHQEWAYCAVSPGDFSIEIPGREPAPSAIASGPASAAPPPAVSEPAPLPPAEKAISDTAAAPARDELTPAPKPSQAPAVPPKAESALVASAIAAIESRKNGAKPPEKNLSEPRLLDSPPLDTATAPVAPVSTPPASELPQTPESLEPAATSRPDQAEAASMPGPAAEGTLAVAAPPPRRSPLAWIALTAAALLGGAWYLRPKRPAGPKPASLISQSLDRDQR